MVTFLLGNMLLSAPCCFLGDESANSFCLKYPASICLFQSNEGLCFDIVFCLLTFNEMKSWLMVVTAV